MSNYDKKSVEELYGELNFLDKILEERKEERRREVEQKEEQLDLKYSQMPYGEDFAAQKLQELVEYKDKLTDKLEINELRAIRQEVKNVIDQKELQMQDDSREAGQQA